MYNKYWIFVPVAAITMQSAYATNYFSVEQAQQAIFAGKTFTKAFVTLTDEQKNEIEHRSDVNVRHKEIQVWKVSGGGYFILDDVVGKHEFITYAIGLNNDGSVKNIEIMEYKETYGDQVRDKEWREQFVGKTASSQLKLDKDIKNISGATLSSRHVTDGVKRILATYEVALK